MVDICVHVHDCVPDVSYVKRSNKVCYFVHTTHESALLVVPYGMKILHGI